MLLKHFATRCFPFVFIRTVVVHLWNINYCLASVQMLNQTPVFKTRAVDSLPTLPHLMLHVAFFKEVLPARGISTSKWWENMGASLSILNFFIFRFSLLLFYILLPLCSIFIPCLLSCFYFVLFSVRVHCDHRNQQAIFLVTSSWEVFSSQVETFASLCRAMSQKDLAEISALISEVR